MSLHSLFRLVIGTARNRKNHRDDLDDPTFGPGDEPVLALLAEQAPEFDLAGRSSPDRPLSAADAVLPTSRIRALCTGSPRRTGSSSASFSATRCRDPPFGDGRELLLYSIGVRAGHRRRGVGNALVEEMIRWMEDAGVPEVWVLADNPGAEAFYAACGFEPGGEGEQGVLMLLPRAGDQA